VFVRLTWQGLDKPEAVVPRLAQAAAAVQQWLGQPLDRLHAAGSAEGGQVALALRFREGATALVSFARTPPQGDGVDLMVLGSRGAIYHDAGSGALGGDPVAAPPERPDPALLALIERALQSRKPEPAEGGKP
jgi:hypothetical protein